MALLSLETRKAIFQYLGLGAYTKKSIKAFQKAYMFREKDWDGVYGQDTDNALRTVYYTKRYTKNFSPKEFRCECGGKYCCGYPSYMKPAQLIHIQAIRDKYGKPITITSGLRCKKWNSALGGSIQNSLHMKGQALDFYQEGVTDTLKNRKATAKWIRKQKNHHYTYGNGIYWLTTDDGASTGSVSAPYMGNALHTDTYNNVKATYPEYKEDVKVIDISNFQDSIDFAKVKSAGIKGVIAKCGYRGAETGKIADDSRFIEHITRAHKAGLAVGLYMFTQAITPEEGKTEADYAVLRWKQAGVPVSFPIAIDTENVFYEEDGKRIAGRANGLSKTKRTAAVKAFCERIKELGYEPMIYASTSWLNNKLDMSKLPYKVWVAQYADKCEYKGKYILWQYSSSGKVNGIEGRVDMNYCYTKLTEVPCPKPPKTIDELAKEVIDGKWGSGDERKEKLEAEGYDYEAVQKRVNELLALPSWVERANAWAKMVAGINKLHYMQYKSGDKTTHTDPIKTKRVIIDAVYNAIKKVFKLNKVTINCDSEYAGWNCIGFLFAIFHYGGEIPCKVGCSVISDPVAEKILNAKTDAEALELVQKRTGCMDWKVIRNKNGIPKSKWKAGDGCFKFEGNTFKHMFYYMGNKKICDSSGRSGDANDIAIRSYDSYSAKVIIRYIGK